MCPVADADELMQPVAAAFAGWYGQMPGSKGRMQEHYSIGHMGLRQPVEPVVAKVLIHTQYTLGLMQPVEYPTLILARHRY